jgi:ADP-ribosylglycohydrolase
MGRIVLSGGRFRDQVHGCWLGKNIGGTLGAPHECKKHVLNLDFYDPVPEKPAANDDLDLQFLWLKLLEDRGTNPPLPYFAEYWTKYAAAYPWNEYGFAHRNLSRGLMPPVAGCFENYFVDEMGSPIRSEIWACAAPANPELAASLAWKDSAVDHAGGEGTWGEMFWAAVESAAFVESDPETLIRIGLGMIPIGSHISRAIREALWCWHSGLAWAEARERIASRFGHLQPCNAIPNHGFTIIGWLYGQDFGDRLCKAVNCSYDTDCTGATLGSVLGILLGYEAIPEKWRKPVGEGVTLHQFTGDCGAPKDLNELTDRTVALARQMSEERSPGVDFGDGEEHELPDDVRTMLFRNEAVRYPLGDPQSAVAMDEGGSGVEIVLHYGGDPVMRPGVGRVLEVSVEKGGVDLLPDGTWLKGPEGWSVWPVEPGCFLVTADAPADRNAVTVEADVEGETVRASFTILGPGEAKGFPAGDNVPTCPKCGARAEACVCGD